ncbi:MAG: thioredoxin [Saprospirales bacterium]|nr:MAG: thioredoxin [Saprospirales bacterium]
MNATKKKVSFKELIHSDTPVLVDFYANWCGPCKMLSPVLAQLASKHSGDIKVVKIDVDKNPGAAQSLQVRGVPTMMLFKNGEILWRKSGYMSLAQLESELQPHMA